MLQFIERVPGIWVLETPFGDNWSGITLVRGPANILIDSGATAAIVDDCLAPALDRLGLALPDLAWLLNTHCHVDHIGGHARIKQLAGVPIATFAGSLDKLRDPLKYNRLIRMRFPADSPPPAPVLLGVEPDRLLRPGDSVAGRLTLLHTPGHDDDTVSWLDQQTGTLICGDSLQGNGTMTQGMGFYQDLDAYRATLRRLQALDLAQIIFGHAYVPFGPQVCGRAEVRACLAECLRLTDVYDRLADELWRAGERDPAAIARQMIRRLGGAEPAFLFLALYTVSAHLQGKS
jgi:glyoxylase-like metal-dependent hydrolase (beta-lactamase superfamily II)